MRAKEFIAEVPAAGNFRNRVWYHGTSKKNYEKMLKSKKVLPSVSDSSRDVGSAIFLTSDPNIAREFGPIILAIDNDVAMKFDMERWSGFPHGMIKAQGIDRKDASYIMIIKEPVPLKYWKLYDIKTGLFK